ncbi:MULTISPECIES: helix-turn-helix domain-containing protein [unclassified Cytobacillus]|uniref:helix-turn-helix domain-containing protein n=1 Tax=unclassified Cytobacillus TaxID=2675268 RepID=UPI00203A64B7|nr:helix-turn-helix transcriptional regulator [Cytobacillus sp. AMY 15.2]MCM3093829.1 helix-turn-helix domain-containing protein [Cytobacillus sp. AMY 15.2]
MMKPEGLKAYRKLLGMSRKEFGLKVGYNEHYIYLLETGRNEITEKTDRQIRKYLDAERESFTEIILTASDALRGFET